VDTEKSNWTFDPIAGQYYWHRFFSHQPDLNYDNPAVVDAIIDVMKFWLDLGVDAFRLDAVPYLCVREGTSNENLPETHAVLKRMRRTLDASYKNRMLLAEANGWPPDVRDYFGDGDECHMAFHFPLMPRMFMALTREDRLPIVDILNQTPDLPDNGQWALFLRNHDELTLEMVTDEERDYMYAAYAADPQARLNLGIRRRLAPLVENSRRRIELLTRLLFALPGTPVVYYGDEIGMGDNIYLGDRNGVRTPMQWTSDRNGGFSKADPARLSAPLIMDPVYGYQSINVEAQERYPFSLLNWTKRLVAMRKQHQVFGRGSLEFVPCPNRKVLAFLRRDDKETILVVVNLARNVQPAELDLKPFAGLTPIEMGGLTAFPRVTEAPYFVTLSAYATYWFSLQAAPMQIAARAGATADHDEAVAANLPSLLIGPDWRNLLDSHMRTVIERHALVAFLRRQPYASATHDVVRARFADWVSLGAGGNPEFVSIVTVESVDGSRDTCLVPLAFVSGDAATRMVKETPGVVLARIAGAREGAIVDGFQCGDMWNRLLELAANEGEIAMRVGSVRGFRLPDSLDLSEATGEPTWKRETSDSGNSLARLGGYFLKVFRRIEPGPNPELEIGRVLRDSGFSHAPRLLGGIEYHHPDVETSTLAVIEQAVNHQGSGWDYTINELHRYYERASARVRRTADPIQPANDEQPPPFFAEVQGWYLNSAMSLGRRTAELHLALADSADAAFSPEPLARGDLQTLTDTMRVRAASALELVAARRHELPESLLGQVDQVLSARDTLLTRFDRLRELEAAGAKIRIHGDYGLRQTLRTGEDFTILDFEGDPSRSIQERREKQSPLRDVAAMIRSYNQAAHAALLAFSVQAPDDASVLEMWADTWQRWVSRTFVRAYRAAIGDSPLVPEGDAFAALLGAFVLDELFDELAYELHNRPQWVGIPLTGILRIGRAPGDPTLRPQ
jgi:maltose alpha-D-glucosyltransferase/alpha-amylase